MDLLPYLLPLGAGLHINNLAIDTDAHVARVELEATARSCPCPSCQQPAVRIHSHYQRTVADMPWGHLVVKLHLLVRTFFCDNSACHRKCFTERLPALVAPSARRTARLTHQHEQLGYLRACA